MVEGNDPRKILLKELGIQKTALSTISETPRFLWLKTIVRTISSDVSLLEASKIFKTLTRSTESSTTSGKKSINKER